SLGRGNGEWGFGNGAGKHKGSWTRPHSPFPTPHSRRRRSRRLLRPHVLALLDGLVDGADHVESLLGQVVDFAVDDHLEAADGVLHRYVHARRAGDHFGHVERLAEEALAFARAGHDLLVFLGQLVHAEDGDDVLQVLVALQRALYLAGDVVVLLADDLR